DRRLNRRCSDLAKHLQSSDLGLGFPGIFEQKHILKAFYRAMNNEKVSPSKLINGNREALAELFSDKAQQNLSSNEPCRIYGYEDTTMGKYPGRKKLELGYLQTNSDRDNGVLIHTMIACDENRHPQGILSQQFIHRDRSEFGKKDQRASRAFEDKESFKWVEPLEELSQWRKGLDFEHRFIVVMDREGDVASVINGCIDWDTDFIIRSRHNRLLSNSQRIKLREFVAQSPDFKEASLSRKLHDRKSGAYYEAECHIRYGQVDLLDIKAPLYVLHLEEMPQTRSKSNISSEAASWWILTSLPLNSPEQAIQALDDYEKRWTITEDFHKALKTGARIEDRQFDSAKALCNVISLLSLVVVRILALRHISDQRPEAPINQIEWGNDKILLNLIPKLDDKYLTPRDREYSKPMTVMRLSQIVARMGGHQGYAQKGRPGWQTLYLGAQKLNSILNTLHSYADIL
ncbi:MAG: IS4 family transposase, partial [Bacteroidota bacterium]